MHNPTFGMAKGIAAGTIAVSLFWLANFAVYYGPSYSGSEAFHLLWMALWLFVFALVPIIAGSVVVGLPALWFLDRRGRANAITGGAIGAGSGLVLFALTLLALGGKVDDDSVAFVLSAALGGGVTGAIWGAAQDRARNTLSADHPNRIDDPRILR